VDVIDTWAYIVLVCVAFEDLEELQVGLGSFDGDDIGIELLEYVPDVVEVCSIQ
jgi:hypothetical protein